MRKGSRNPPGGGIVSVSAPPPPGRASSDELNRAAPSSPHPASSNPSRPAAISPRTGRATALDLQQNEGVEHPEDSEEDRRAIEVALDHRAAPEGAAATADPEGAGEAGVLPRMQEHEEDQDDRDEDLRD